MAERRKTDGEWNLEEIVEHTDAAKEHLKHASKVAERSGDKAGAKELADEAEAVGKTHEKFKGIKDKKAG